MITMEDFQIFVNENIWIFAKTYADWAPHEYVVKEKIEEKYQIIFSELVIFIRENGFPAFFGNKEHIYLYHGHYYWTMGDSPEEAIIINRCKYDDYRMSYRENKNTKK